MLGKGNPNRNRTLSRREVQIARLVQEAKTNKEIASELSLSPGTTKQYIHIIFQKLGVKNRTELALWSREALGGRNLRPTVELPRERMLSQAETVPMEGQPRSRAQSA